MQRIVDMWRQKVRDYDRIYQEGVAVLSDINEGDKRRDELGFPYRVEEGVRAFPQGRGCPAGGSDEVGVPL
ncbi:hypothetical protein [Tardisphaera saccharovorans]